MQKSKLLDPAERRITPKSSARVEFTSRSSRPGSRQLSRLGSLQILLTVALIKVNLSSVLAEDGVRTIEFLVGFQVQTNEKRRSVKAMTAEAYGQAYQHGFDRTIRLLLSRGARIDCAREAAQAAWAKGWERIGQLRNESVVATWVNTIALNCHRSVIRSENHQLPLTDLATSADVNVACIDLDRILARCRPSDRQLFDDYLQGYPIEEIAGRHGISNTAARIRLLRARRAVQSRIKERKSVVCANRSKLNAECQIAA
jgi:DNA-directed RNA polymerase specialized sigma24 family protein